MTVQTSESPPSQETEDQGDRQTGLILAQASSNPVGTHDTSASPGKTAAETLLTPHQQPSGQMTQANWVPASSTEMRPVGRSRSLTSLIKNPQFSRSCRADRSLS
ncbi:unnamed protein product [Protopolystoma xenopodis]|uniref:Uncharacterized protein n=1 Tax=Protopolystoma xenopodis TaxID=117903 RepID=A0A448XQT0_9PLAT|nr:unnamed protein product [Protopolystoma xenopodis]